ncbi:hypothetical protein ISS05_00725 [Candidatus Woesearchaeota archaeon]|nr:hypothetical protein [Candidatus Woesearchaeota archaeon]
MALFSFGKKKETKEEVPPAAPPQGLPVDQILTMKQQGYADNQIVENLQSQGYNSSQVFDAMNQANMSQQPSQQMPPPSEFLWQQPAPEQYPSAGQPPEDYRAAAPVTERERIEELAEAIIDEKWNELVKDINKVIGWKEKTESRLNKIEQRSEDIRLGLESLHKSLMAKISDYDKDISNVGVEIKAMEKVFQKILPSLTENIGRLERLGKKTPSKN